MPDDWRLRRARWDRPADRAALMAVRRQVFIDEQGVPEALEWDDADARAIHLLAETRQGQPVGTVRLLPDGQIGRMAVLPPFRRRGIGRALLQAALDAAHQSGLTEVWLHAQTHALPFYRHAGFHPEGPEFTEAGIPHRRMRRSLRDG